MNFKELNHELGNIDLYLLDQILKGRFEGKKTVLDSGCGEGRNLNYFVKNGFEVHGIDINPMAIKMAGMTYPKISKNNWHIGSVDELPFQNEYFESIISSAVLHFMSGDAQFNKAFSEHVRVLKKEGLFFIRMASDLGLSNVDFGSFSYILTQSKIRDLLDEHSLQLVEPVKSVLVHQRSMITLVLQKV